MSYSGVERRRHIRVQTDFVGSFRPKNKGFLSFLSIPRCACQIRDLSIGGARFSAPSGKLPEIGALIELNFQKGNGLEIGPVVGKVLESTHGIGLLPDDGRCRVEFVSIPSGIKAEIQFLMADLIKSAIGTANKTGL